MSAPSGDIVIAYRKFAEPLGFRSLIAIPISARFGDNVSSVSERTPWYQGGHLVAAISKRIEVEEDRRGAPFRLPVQWVNRPHLDFRGFAGTIPSGRVARGERSSSPLPAKQTKVKSILVADQATESAEAGDAVTLTLADEVDIARGDVLAHPTAGRRSPISSPRISSG